MGGENVTFGRYDRKSSEKHFVRGWWTDLEDKKITKALAGDTVKFHVETKDIEDGRPVFMTLYDDDRRINQQEDSANDKIDLTNSSTGSRILFQNVSANKIVRTINLSNLETFFGEEQDKKLELFFACSYRSENADLPKQISDYLEVSQPEPLILYVCGYWNKSMPYAGSEWGEQYWGSSLKAGARKYFFNTTKELFINGAGTKFSSATDRFQSGKKIAEERFINHSSKFYKEVFQTKRKVMVISHSMGGAFAEGLIDVLKQKNVNIEKVVHLSPADVSGFRAGLPDKTFQIDIDWDPVLMYKNFNDAPNIGGIQSSALAKNPKDDEFGHMYTKEEDFVWKWFEDLEAMQFQLLNQESKIYTTPGSGMGYGGTSRTVLQINYSATNLKHNSTFLKVRKNSQIYFYDKKTGNYFTER
ncbi:hypothetical protein ACFPVY_01335 [Flavobacterium qiangtangense]|uniref:PGAP1-like protein n=1 Tax=Flavobacterium qiangtangense TaxID=1442595 RepID=A0ABW1PI30_9FLAO